MDRTQIDMILRAVAAATVIIVAMGLCYYIAEYPNIFNVVSAIMFVSTMSSLIVYMIYTPVATRDTYIFDLETWTAKKVDKS